ncbi:MAG TPA: hypothetical protein VJK51_03415 [Candidatus Nanoarchaeia archaeon]|nr:hypothetical protein [Candidatus Nanoarchaeia archaeon]
MTVTYDAPEIRDRDVRGFLSAWRNMYFGRGDVMDDSCRVDIYPISDAQIRIGIEFNDDSTSRFELLDMLYKGLRLHGYRLSQAERQLDSFDIFCNAFRGAGGVVYGRR